MSSKPKQSIAIQRQIPEHIRLGNPLFVEFLKSYYDFLEQTQSQELEKIRDIDTSLDEFINRFTSELSTGIPFANVKDKRMLIKHLREFYLSRGSEASFKFLFRTVFDKEAELFYPSTQVLRVSDGKWRQDVSIFVKVTQGVETLSPLNGNYIELTTTRVLNGRSTTKTFRTYVDRVIQYATGTFELYIQRDFANEIIVGTRVSFTDEQGINYSGNVLPCPAKLSIYKAGKNFKVGDIFSLKTSIGSGCVIKVSKVGPLGEIKSIKLIRVGLDYETTFYSYLSATQIESIEYVHPAKLNTPFVPRDPAYNERSGGFIDFGFANKQTYFDYDANIPVANTSFASDRFFADSSYVGDIETQFYAEDITNPIDENLAIIQIDLGAVARYPGYYETQDGFISDEMFIQDGNYYQAYSYVIKVEEELRKYADIVRKVLHPAGMKLFSEYNITNTLSLAAVKQAISNVLERVNNVAALDQGIGYTKYDLLSDDPDNIVYVPDFDAPKVFSPFGKAAYYVNKKISDTHFALDAPSKLLSKPFEESLLGLFDAQVKLVSKALTEVIGLSDRGFNYDNYIHSFVNGEVVVTPDPNSMIVNAAAGKTAQFVTKRLSEIVLQLSAQAKSLNKPLSDSFIPEDAVSKLFDKSVASILAAPIDSQEKLFNKSLSELIFQTDEQVKSYFKELSDSFALIVTEELSVSKGIVDSFGLTDAQSKQYSKLLDDAFSINDSKELFFEKLSQSFFTTFDSSFLEVTKNFQEVIFQNDLQFKDFMSSKQDSIAIQDTIELARTKIFEEMILVSDESIKTISKEISDMVDYFDMNSKVVETSANDQINITSAGAIYKNPYDAELYFAPEDQYQANTPIT